MKRSLMFIITAAMLVMLLSAAGCGKKAEPLSLPSAEDISSVDITMASGAELNFNEADEVAQIMSALAGAKPTDRKSVNDVPDESAGDYGKICLHEGIGSTDIYYYEDSENAKSGDDAVKECIEVPYKGIYTLDKDIDTEAAKLILSDVTKDSGSQGTDSSEFDLPDNTVITFSKVAGSGRLLSDIGKGRMPKECNLVYDEMGGRPDVTVTDQDEIMKIYQMLGQISVEGESKESITDSYHHVIFTLSDGSSVGFGFEGTGILTTRGGNYSIAGDTGLWKYIKDLQDKEIKN